MGYILKNTSGLINTRLTDIGRKKLSQGFGVPFSTTATQLLVVPRSIPIIVLIISP